MGQTSHTPPGSNETDVSGIESRLDTLNTTSTGIKTAVESTTPKAVYLGPRLMLGSDVLAPVRIPIAVAASGTLVAADATKKILVLSYTIVTNGATNVKFQGGVGGTDLTGLHYFDAAGKGVSVGFSPLGHFETAVNTLLYINLSAAVGVGGHLTYVLY